MKIINVPGNFCAAILPTNTEREREHLTNYPYYKQHTCA